MQSNVTLNERDFSLEVGGREDRSQRGRARAIVRGGLESVRGVAGERNDYLSAASKDKARYRAGVALLLSKEQMLEETGWTAMKLANVRDAVEDEERAFGTDLDPVAIYADYREQQLLCARELMDLAEYYRTTDRLGSATAAIKARSDILDKVIKMGQELGLLRRSAREIRLTGRVDVRKMTSAELKIHLLAEFKSLGQYLDEGSGIRGTAAKVLERVAGPARSTTGPRVKKLAG